MLWLWLIKSPYNFQYGANVKISVNIDTTGSKYFLIAAPVKKVAAPNVLLATSGKILAVPNEELAVPTGIFGPPCAEPATPGEVPATQSATPGVADGLLAAPGLSPAQAC